MNLENLKAMLENDYLVFFRTHDQEIIEAHECIDGDGRITLSIIDSTSGINEPRQEIVLPETLESYLIVYKQLDGAEVADLLADDTCSCCEKGTNTLHKCPTCPQYICQDCEGIHVCDPDDSHENYMRDLREDPITGYPECGRITDEKLRT